MTGARPLAGPAFIRRPTARAVVPVAVLAAATAAVAYVGLVDPNQPGHYPTCPFLQLTGYYCPGCGTLRCLHVLAHGHLAQALGFNALTVAMLPLLAWMWLRWTVRTVRASPRRTVAPAWSIRLLFWVIVVFWVVRNLPVGAALAP